MTTPKDRSNTAIRFNRETYDRLKVLADDYELSINWLVNRAVKDYLDRVENSTTITIERKEA